MPHRTTKRQIRVSKTGHTKHDRQESTGGNKRLAKKRVHRLNKFIESNNVHLKELT